jgi:adenylate cyclase
MQKQNSTEFDKPYPLQMRFRRWGLPAAAVTFAVLVMLVGFGGTGLVERIYLNLAEGRAQTIVVALEKDATKPWHQLVSGVPTAQVYNGPGGEELMRTLNGEVRELGLERLKIYNDQGIIVFSTESAQIGKPDRSPAFLHAIGVGGKTVVRKPQPDGTSLYELYVPLQVVGGEHKAVIELYEATGRLDSVLFSTLLPAIAVPGLLLILLFWALDRLVSHAQTDIDARSRLVSELRGKLEQLISGSAADAAMDSVGKGRMESKKVVCTLFYSDIRDFTGYAEGRTPEQVVDFLNQLMDLQVAAIDATGGDVDKMIGDAVLARFEGEGAARRAIDAARRVLAEINSGDYARDVGIGIYTGEVISGVVGGEKRMDFTVIGDSVNISARLCSAAAGGELVADSATIDQADDTGFGEPEDITVKGRRDALQVRRWVV